MNSSFRRAVTSATVLVLLVQSGLLWSAPEEPTRSFLWRVRSSSTTLYLLGSVHVMKPDAYPLSRTIETAFEQSETIVFEADLDTMTAAAFELLARGTLPDDTTLRDVVSPETYQATSEHLEQLGLGAEGFQKMRPWLLAVTLIATELTRAGYDQSSGIDRHLFERAKTAGKRILALETAEFQIGLFAGLTRDEDEAFLRHTLQELDTIIPVVDGLIEQWRSGAVAEVESLLIDPYDEFPELFEKMVTDRNRNWLPRLEELLAGEERVMAVVGALHLVGDQGVVELLRRRGYQVEQL